ncbi:Aspartokinase [Mucinivorans hirudinis]|uniref:Aspartokinase n=1 Tax=Mucinivorans hirudinis TaxID=1433126 RepID=A0A060R7L2_9BACT|nr:Aspartokinase [Mucinivorans hirudinis]
MKKTLKFGGTSVGSAENMRKVAAIIRSERAQLTVLSAMSGTTDALVKITQTSGFAEKQTIIDLLGEKYSSCIGELLSDKTDAIARMEATLDFIASPSSCDEGSAKAVLAQGELLTTYIFTKYIEEQGCKAVLLNAPDFMHTDADGKVDTTLLKNGLANLDKDTFYITQGFICTNAGGELDNLGRGGSDYSAALMGVAIGSAEVQIWTDIDGMHNNDPRFVEKTYPIRRMSFDEAAELAYFGAKILHPATILPCKEAGVNVRLKNTMDAAAEGTLIAAADDSAASFHAVAAKDNITVIRITSARMLMAYGFLRKVFEIFEKWRTPIDMITTSEVAVSLTIDSTCHLQEIVAELSPLGHIEVESGNTIVCVVGRINYEASGLAAQIFKSVSSVAIKMISYGASHRSLSLLINTTDKKRTLQSLNDFLF